MPLSPYIQPLPYGPWALSFAVLMGAFFWARSEENWGGDCGERSRRREGQDRGEENEEEEEEEEANDSSAYRTDQEVDQAYQRALGRIPNRRRSLFATMRPAESSEFPPAASAAAAAASAVRRSHLDHVVDRRYRCRLEREAFRVRVHEHVGRELARETIQAAAALASVAEPGGMGMEAGRTTGNGDGGR